jgi:hypothetical protein
MGFHGKEKEKISQYFAKKTHALGNQPITLLK